MPSQQVLTSLETLHKELEKLEPAIKHVETAEQVTKIVKEIPKMHVDLLTEIKKNDADFKKELVLICGKEINDLAKETKALQGASSEVLHKIQEKVTALNKLKDTIQAYYDRIEKINFPERLDKIDLNISGIVASIQSVQTRIENLDRNITDRIKELSERQKEALASAEIKAAVAVKKQQTMTYVTWLLIIAGIIVYFVIKK